MRLVTWAGGVGKTRLALNVAEWQGQGREWLMVATGGGGDAVAAARGVTSGLVLLVVDCAETRAELESC